MPELAACESCCVPHKFPGMVSEWPATTTWQGPSGLRRLGRIAGSAHVSVMVSEGQMFYGDITRHQPCPCTFEQFLRLASEALTANDAAASESHSQAGTNQAFRSATSQDASCTSAEASRACSSSQRQPAQVSGNAAPCRAAPLPKRLYLAQQPLTGPLSALLQEVPQPPILAGRSIAQSNLWMSVNTIRCGAPRRERLHTLFTLLYLQMHRKWISHAACTFHTPIVHGQQTAADTDMRSCWQSFFEGTGSNCFRVLCRLISMSYTFSGPACTTIRTTTCCASRSAARPSPSTRPAPAACCTPGRRTAKQQTTAPWISWIPILRRTRSSRPRPAPGAWCTCRQATPCSSPRAGGTRWTAQVRGVGGGSRFLGLALVAT